jgi:agmatine deiminase
MPNPIAEFGDALPRMPAEWEPHEATWLAWPQNRSDWPGKFNAIPLVYAEIARHLAQVERVEVICRDATVERAARRVLRHCAVNLDGVRFHHWPTNRAWLRDSGPIFVRLNGQAAPRTPLLITNWGFNAWAKYPDWELDNALPGNIARELSLSAVEPQVNVAGRILNVILEGGSIDVNGCGTMLTTEECLLSAQQQRNPGLGRDHLEQVFAQYLGARKVIWLNRGIVGDDTHGHVDDIARFVTPDTVLACVEHNVRDPNYEPLHENLERLRAATDQDGHPLRVLELPMPAPVVYRKQRLPASYANFYVANDLVLVPTFNDPRDRRALNILSELFSDREVVGVYCRDLVWGLGTLHCMTQQQPKISL